MSQYPQQQPPYPTPPINYDYARPNSGGGDPLAAARRASVLMFVLGGLMTLLGFCNLAGTLALSSSELQAMLEQQQAAVQPGQRMPLTPETYRTLALVTQSVVLVGGVLLVALGAGTRRGGRGAMVGGVVVSGLAVVVLLLMVLASLVAALVSPPLALAACVFAIPTALFGLLIVWLTQALRAGRSPAAAAMQQYQAQMWYYQQQQQAYQQAAGGQQPPPPPQYPPQYSTQYPPQQPGGYYPPPPPPQQQGYGYGQPAPPPPQQQQQPPFDSQRKDPDGPPPQG